MVDLGSDWTLQVDAETRAVALPLHLPAHDDRDISLERVIPVSAPSTLHLAQLGPHAEVSVDGVPVLSAHNLFRSYAIELAPGDRRVRIVLRSPVAAMKDKRPRPRWKTRLVDHQQLRWVRAPLLGRMPSWSPTNAARGVYAVPTLVAKDALRIAGARVHARLEGRRGVVDVVVPPCEARTMIVHLAGATAQLARSPEGWRGQIAVEQPTLWWPHTHGEPARHPLSLDVDGHPHALPSVGFRTITAALGDRFALQVNDIDVFCRGAVWVPRLEDDHGTRAALEALRDAGGNMVRVSGTMRYEGAAFLHACDELGLLVWQDFMLANMDYPVEDPAFAAELTAELDEQLERLAAHPSVAILCGGSEVAQQAAMVGQPAERWYGPLFETLIPQRCAARLPELPYVPGSPSSPAGALPFRVDIGVAHYYGVGAYERPFTDARLADVTFASECLGLSNVPEPAAIEALFGDDVPATHTPRWKAGVPRDNASGWDFEDVRDHYFRELFATHPVAFRYADTDGYLERSRIVSGEVMARVFAEWRRHGSRTRGGLVWFLRDLYAGAGWGLLDSSGEPKSVLSFLRRAWAPTALFITDEGVNGLRLHVVHEGASERRLNVKLTLVRGSETIVASVHHALVLAPRSTSAHDVDLLFGGFRDVGHAYRFGSRGHDLVVASLWDGEARLAECSHLPIIPTDPIDAKLGATLRSVDEHRAEITITAARLALYTVVRVPGWRATDGWFHVLPGESRTVGITRHADKPPRGFVHALGSTPARVAP